MNRSTAVMQRRNEPADSLDYFPTPPWATRALFEHVLPEVPWKYQSVHEPACGEGYMSEPIKEYAHEVLSTDIFDYGYQDFVFDYLNSNPCHGFNWVITNPPFKLAAEFIQKGIDADISQAHFVRSAFFESVGRYNNIFKDNPPTTVAVFVERVPLVKGRVDEKAGSATSYAWFVWEHAKKGQPTELIWIPPCRKELEKDEDYVHNQSNVARS